MKNMENMENTIKIPCEALDVLRELKKNFNIDMKAGIELLKTSILFPDLSDTLELGEIYEPYLKKS